MCCTVFIATVEPQKTEEFISEVTKLYLETPTEEQLEALKDKFTLPYIYYVGSDTQCSCGFEFHSDLFDEPDWQDSKASPLALLEFLKTLLNKNDVEFYCCWDGDWNEPIESSRKLKINEITLEKNYFELVERDLIKFEKLKYQ